MHLKKSDPKPNPKVLPQKPKGLKKSYRVDRLSNSQ